MQKETKKTIRIWSRKTLRMANNVLNILPQKGDGPATLVLRGLAALNLFSETFFQAEGIWAEFISAHAVESADENRRSLIQFILKSKLSNLFTPELFNFHSNMDDEKLAFEYYSHEKYGEIFVYTEYMIYLSKKFDDKAVISELWSLYPNGIMLDVIYTSRGRELAISDVSVQPKKIIQHTKDFLTTFTTKHLKLLDKTRTRSYMFVGEPGTGKTTFAQYFANKFTKKTIKITSAALSHLTFEFYDFLLTTIQPEAIIIDDVDKAFDKSRLLQILEDLPKKFDNITIVFTANKLNKLDPALIRPGRIDDIVEFDLPTQAERRELLQLYCTAKDISEEAFDELAKATAGLTHSWLKEIAIQMAIDSHEEIISRIQKMLRLVSETDAPQPTSSTDNSLQQPVVGTDVGTEGDSELVKKKEAFEVALKKAVATQRGTALKS